jgi:hypothetical protein
MVMLSIVAALESSELVVCTFSEIKNFPAKNNFPKLHLGDNKQNKVNLGF